MMQFLFFFIVFYVVPASGLPYLINLCVCDSTVGAERSGATDISSPSIWSYHGCTSQPPLAARLRVPERIIFRISMQTYADRALHGDAPQYLRQFTPIADIPSRQRPRSSSSDDLLVPAVRLPTVGRCASLSPVLAHGTTYRTGRRHFSTVSAHLQKTTKPASVSTFIPWPSLIN